MWYFRSTILKKQLFFSRSRDSVAKHLNVEDESGLSQVFSQPLDTFSFATNV